MILGLALAVVATLPDPRPEIAELVLRGASDVALERIDRALGEDRAGSERNGLDYLRGDQLDRLGRREQAMEQFVAALGSERLAARARLRLARLRFEAEEPTVAAGLIASLVSPGVDRGTRSEAIDLFLRSLEAGGDCRLLAGVRSDRFRGSERRELELARGECAEREQDDATAAALATRLLEQATDDALAREAAELLARTTLAEGRDRRQRLLLARTAYAHREFELARTLFLEVLGGSATSSREWDDGYALARSEFWLAEHDAAAERFAALARAATSGRDRANALFQAGRSSELAGRWDEASRHFEAARGAEPLGGWAGAAQLAALRLAALSGDEAAAEGLLRSLASRRSWRQELARGAFFLASGRLARGESEGTAAWLERARQSGVAGAEELAYWEGRRAELEGSHARAVDAYVEAVTSDPFHPFARLAAERLRSATLAPAARARGFALASGNSIADLRSAALLLGSDDPLGAKTRVEARARVARLPGGGVWLDWSPVPPVEWSVYRSPPKDAGDLLVALGRLDEAPGVVSRWFPAADTRVAFTGAAALAAAGGHRSSLARAESLFERLPATVPIDWVDADLRRLLYPLPFAESIREQSALRGVDPNLLAAILREESRFDPEAVSPATAVGLSQFVYSTARRLARDLGLPEPLPGDLRRPEVSIALGAGYLAELAGRFGGRVPAIVTAYNAGETQTELWLRYCFTQDEAEFLSKVGFRETRAYLRRVLRSRAHYAALERGEGAQTGLSAAVTLR
ncbi:MAG: lytic transglycosylase domain-containing protein [Holophagales bacterium]|nr:lytic transglycosylase domain-containing protein [Holophagales bacterium]